MTRSSPVLSPQMEWEEYNRVLTELVLLVSKAAEDAWRSQLVVIQERNRTKAAKRKRKPMSHG